MSIGSTWAGTYDFTAARLHVPRDLAQVQEVVARSPRIRVLGSRHSFHDLADSPGDLLSLASLPLQVEVDTDSRTAVVPGGATYGEIAVELDAAGWAVPAMASLPHISVAGAVATGTHGSGVGTPSLAGTVVGVEIVGPDGEVRWVEHGEPGFDGVVVSLGALGAVTRLRLAVEPRYEVRQDVLNGVPWRTVAERFEEIGAAAHSVSVFTRWQGEATEQIWFKGRSDAAPTIDLDGTWATQNQHPILGLDAVNCTAQLGRPGPWYDRLPHFRMGFTPSNGAEIQSEYLLPRANAAAAMDALATLGPRLAPVIQVNEIRTVAADEQWLGLAHGGDAVAFHFTFDRDPDAVRDVLGHVEAALLPLGARPHWGKWFVTPRVEIEQRYPRLDDFRDLVARTDPGGKFRNGFLDTHVL